MIQNNSFEIICGLLRLFPRFDFQNIFLMFDILSHIINIINSDKLNQTFYT